MEDILTRILNQFSPVTLVNHLIESGVTRLAGCDKAIDSLERCIEHEYFIGNPKTNNHKNILKAKKETDKGIKKLKEQKKTLESILKKLRDIYIQL